MLTFRILLLFVKFSQIFQTFHHFFEIYEPLNVKIIYSASTFKCSVGVLFVFSSTAAFTLSHIDYSLSMNYNKTYLLEYHFLGSFQYFNYLHNNFSGIEASVCFREIVIICVILLIAFVIKQEIIYFNMTL